MAVGAGAAALAWRMMTLPARPTVADEYLARSVPQAGGPNVVNVIIVDFRGFDTLGEITVLVLAALIVRSILTGFSPRYPQASGLAGALPSLLLQKVAPLVLPFALLLAVHLFLRGHHLPGGGFVAGLVVAIAFIAQYMISGTRWVEARLALLPHRWIAAGLLIALLTGLGSLLLGYPFLTTHTAHVHWPLVGEVHLPSAALFDVGVFAVVVGSTLLLLTAIAHQSLRARRRQSAAAPETPEDEWKR